MLQNSIIKQRVGLLSLKMDLNLNGARIGETSVPNSYRPILLPFQNKPITHFSMDIGGSLAKMVYFEPNEGMWLAYK